MYIDTKSCKLNTHVNGNFTGWNMVFNNKSGSKVGIKYFSNNKQFARFLYKQLTLRKNAPKETIKSLMEISDIFQDEFSKFEEKFKGVKEINLDAIAPNTVLQQISKNSVVDNGESYWQWGYYSKKGVFTAYGLYGSLPNLLNWVVETSVRNSDVSLKSIEELLELLNTQYSKAMDMCESY